MPGKRSKKSKILPAAAILTAVLSSILVQGMVSSARAAETIGVLTPLSGRFADLGRSLSLGVKLANKARRVRVPLKIVVADSGCDGEIAKTAINKLIKAKVNIIVGPLCSATLSALFVTEELNGIPVLSAYVKSSDLAKQHQQNQLPYYSLNPAENQEAGFIAKTISRRWIETPFAILDDGSVYGRGLADDLRLLLEEKGVKPVTLGNFRPLQTNQTFLLRRIAKSAPEALFVAGDADDVAVIARDADKQQMNVEILGAEPLILLPYVDKPEMVKDGLLAVFPVAADSFPAAKSVIQAAKKQRIKLDGAALRGYVMEQIAVGFISENLFDNGIPSTLAGPYDSLFGPLTFDPTGSADALPLKLHVWRAGKFVPLDDQDAIQ